jgi:hypothetical protein
VRGEQGVELTEWESDGARVLGRWQHHDDGVITARKAPCAQADRGQGIHERSSHDSDPGVRSLCRQCLRTKGRIMQYQQT